MLRFDPLQFPLKGQRLIEASAGTGKTYSIALIFLRLILERKLDVDQILVVTFTRAATEELRFRISSRLREALHFFDKKETESADEILVKLLSEIPDKHDAATRLSDALARMDEAAVFTIHGFCQRMLQENSFESGSLFDIEFIETEKPLRCQILEDFWRRRFYSASREETKWALSQWNGPDGLGKSLSGVASQPGVACIPVVSPDEVQQNRKQAEHGFRHVCVQWQACGHEIEDLLLNDTSLSKNKKDGYSRERVELVIEWMNSLDGNSTMPWVLPNWLELLSESYMRSKLLKKKQLPEHPFFTVFDSFWTAHSEFLRTIRFDVLREARSFLLSELAQRKNMRAKMYFDDLLTLLEKGLESKSGPALIKRIRNRFAAALIDEFQDTDPVQYRIVNKLFGQGPESALFMIGDPKQSIYSFRGADIFTYIKARRDTPESGRFTMGTNYRSTTPMIMALNEVFKPQDAFIFDKDIVFHPVEAGGKADGKPFLRDGNKPRPLQAMLLSQVEGCEDAVVTKTKAEEIATLWTAHEIARLLMQGADGNALLGDKNLTGGDVAVLVRTHHEANLMQQALSRLNIASVYYSQDSVFETEEAGQLYLALFALLEPSNEGAVRAALVTDLFGLNGTDLYHQQKNDTEREMMFAELQEYQRYWLSNGLMAMFQRLLAKRNIVQRLLSGPGGERKLTNYLHLVELIQEASLQLEGLDSVIRWYYDQLHNPEPDKASQQLRLENDENLVRIITIHKAKGLEYPVVFLPYLWRTRAVKKDDIFSFHDPDSGQVVADLGTRNLEYYKLAERERLAEDLRLLYVAMTRASHMCCYCWGKVKELNATPLAWLLHRGKNDEAPAVTKMSAAQIQADLDRLNDAGKFVDFVEYPKESGLDIALQKNRNEVAQPKHFKGMIKTDWAITSYSQLTMSHGTESVLSVLSEDAMPEKSDEKDLSVFSFPRGPAAGNCLHGILEQVDFTNTDNGELPEIVEDHLVKSGIESQWNPVVCGWVKDIVETEFDETGLCLANIGQDDRLVEMGFYFGLKDVSFEQINQTLSDFSISPLDARQDKINGLMKGFIDLVFCHQGRFFIADYKSNYLGADYADYSPLCLQEAMADHRYDLQYLIYTVALHRYLQTRVSDYDYDRHFGGVYYLFLRGMKPDNGPDNGVFFSLPPRELVERLDTGFGCSEKL